MRNHTVPHKRGHLSPKKIQVEILNPPGNGHAFTSLRQAQRFCDLGRARFVTDRQIEFIHRLHQRDMLDAELRARAKKREAELGYDGITRRITLDEARRLPVVRPNKLFY